jgi:predicted ATPase/DNA-binding SARP family transcriptional activator
MGAAYVQLLGGARVRRGSKWISFLPDKRYQLLAYLGYRGEALSREHLAFLFWPDTPPQTARQNLRKLLQRVRALPWLTGLEVDGQVLGWPVETDVALLRQALAEAAWQRVVALYQGPLLFGLEGDDAPEFSAWLEIERANLQSSWRDALLQRVAELDAQEAYREAAALLETLLAHDTLDEEALATYLNLACRSGQRERALKIYHDFTQRLEEELELEPTVATQQLAQTLREGSAEVAKQVRPRPPAIAPRSAPPHLSVVATPFVGRDVELAEVAHLLSKPECRLLTITGVGGVGKTRIALKAAEELEKQYPDGVHVVSLESLTSPEAIPPAIAEALAIGLRGSDAALEQVTRHVSTKQLLLLLDNVEHLIQGVAQLAELLRRCPNLKLLVTSRERLNLDEEWLLPVEGLPLPPNHPYHAAAPDEAQAYDAVQLFVERARRIHPRFILALEDLPHVIEICRSVEGLPLAIELAAVWVRTLSCAEIAQEIAHNLDFLTTPSRNPLERHRSIRAAFEHSWKLLTPKEQEALRRLSVFRGGFRREAAAIVAGVSMPVLAALVDKSLLRTTPKGRYDRHPLLYQYTQEKLAEHPNEQIDIQNKHGVYYLRFLQRWGEELMADDEQRTVKVIEEELENVLAAWRLAVKRRWLTELGHCATVLRRFFRTSGRLSEARALYEHALEGLDDSQQHAAIGSLMVSLGYICLDLGRYEQAVSLARNSLTFLRPAKDEASWLAHSFLGHVSLHVGDWTEARRCYQKALVVAKAGKESELKRSSMLVSTLHSLAVLETRAGNYPRAERLLEACLALKRQPSHDLRINHAWGEVTLCQGRLESARGFFTKGLRLARAGADRDWMVYLLVNLALADCKLGKHREAEALAHEALAVLREVTNKLVKAEALTTLGRVHTATSAHLQAETCLATALDVARSARAIPWLLHAVVGLAELQIQNGRAERAAKLLASVGDRPNMHQLYKELAARLRREVEDALSPGAYAEACRRGKTLGLDGVVAQVLGRLPVDVQPG